MAFGKKARPTVDKDGAALVMRGRDYLADFSGQLGLGIMANLVGQLQYFYTDKVGIAVGSVGIVMVIAKIVDALTDIWFGNIIDHSKGGNMKYYKWMLRMAGPAAAITVLIFTVPIGAGQLPAVLYALVTNLLITAVIYTMIATPFSATMIVRTQSQQERGKMGIYRAVGNYASGMVIAIATIPVTNMLGGTQLAWIKYGAGARGSAYAFDLLPQRQQGHEQSCRGNRAGHAGGRAGRVCDCCQVPVWQQILGYCAAV